MCLKVLDMHTILEMLHEALNTWFQALEDKDFDNVFYWQQHLLKVNRECIVKGKLDSQMMTKFLKA